MCIQHVPVCAFKMSPCVPATCPHVFFMWACCPYTRGHFERTHGDVLNAHTGVFSVPHHNKHRTTHNHTHHTTHNNNNTAPHTTTHTTQHNNNNNNTPTRTHTHHTHPTRTHQHTHPTRTHQHTHPTRTHQHAHTTQTTPRERERERREDRRQKRTEEKKTEDRREKRTEEKKTEDVFSGKANDQMESATCCSLDLFSNFKMGKNEWLLWLNPWCT